MSASARQAAAVVCLASGAPQKAGNLDWIAGKLSQRLQPQELEVAGPKEWAGPAGVSDKCNR